jgi:hypothetical protein
MKKIILTMLLLFVNGFTQIHSQTVQDFPLTVKKGIRFDANSSHFILSETDELNYKIRFGFSVGGFSKIEFSHNFALQPEILLHYKNSIIEEKNLGNEMNFQYFGAEIPIYAMYQANRRNCWAGAGLYFGFGIDAHYKIDGLDDVNLYQKHNGQKSEMNRFDFGTCTVIGHEFSNRLQVYATCKIGFVHHYANKYNTKMRNHTVSLGLGYRFRK